MTFSAESASTEDREFFTSRVFDASRERVVSMFSNQSNLTNWWGPTGFKSTFHEFAFKPGGVWRFTMHGPDGKDYPNRNIFQQTGTDQIVILHDHPQHRFVMTITLTEMGAKTKMTWRMVFDSAEERNRAASFVPEANEQNLDRLAAQLARTVAK